MSTMRPCRWVAANRWRGTPLLGGVTPIGIPTSTFGAGQTFGAFTLDLIDALAEGSSCPTITTPREMFSGHGGRRGG